MAQQALECFRRHFDVHTAVDRLDELLRAA
jgi:hypothetical protein